MRIKLAVAVLLAAGMVAIVQAQGGGQFRGMGGGGGPAFLVTIKAVQEELKMTEEQTTKVSTWAKEFGDTSRKMIAEKVGKDTPKEERAEKMAAVRAELNKDAYKALGDVLKKEQVERLKQIDRQHMGVEAFSDADVVAALKLNDSQKTSVKGITGDFVKERGEIMADAGVGGKKGKFDLTKMADAQKKIVKIRAEYVGKVAEVLTDEQKKTWKELTGEAFDQTKLIPTFGKQKD
jgi:hypothetical protein